jgi:putative phosphoribosyl transferase
VIFRDRRDAGRRLGETLLGLRGLRPVVLGLPRGGVPVAAEVARVLDAPLDVLVVRKIGAPWQPEFAVGALARDVIHLDPATLDQLGLSERDLEATIREEAEELERRESLYRGDRSPVSVRDRTVIVVDDGLATGQTAMAALTLLRRMGARYLILAVPVGGPDTRARMAGFADDVVCLSCPTDFHAVSEGYRDFSPTSDAEVLASLRASAPLAMDRGET